MKQRRISLACTTCRRRKSKCDGQRPTCSYCQQTNSQCEYQEISQDLTSTRRHETRAQLMLKVQALESRLNKDTPTPSTQMINESIEPASPHASNILTSSILESTQESLTGQRPVSESDEEENVDLLATETFEEGTESDIGYFGPSSNHVFFRSLSDLFARTLTTVNTYSFARSTTLPIFTDTEAVPSTTVQSLATPSETRKIENPGFPSHSEALQLLEYYFSTIGQMTPFVEKSMALSDLRKVMQEHQKQLKVKRALLYMLFASACSSVEPAKSLVFYKNALTCLGNERMRGASLVLLQAFMLVANYQQNHQMSVTSWTYHALAVKTAFQLGLQSPPAYRRFGQHERDHRLKIWYSLINQDRALCLCLGRPCLIPMNYIHTPKLEEVRDSTQNYISTHMHDIQSQTHHVQLISLHDIVACILNQIYHDNIELEIGATAQALISARLPIQWKLENWRTRLHSYCRVISSDELMSDPNLAEHDRFRLILSIYYYRTILFLNGPALLTILKETLGPTPVHNTDGLLEHAVPIVRHEFNALRDLHQIMSIILARGDIYIDQNNVWWLCNYTCLTIAMHLFCLLLFCHIHSTFLASVGILAADVRKILDEALYGMVVIQRSSEMTRKAHRCLLKFVKLFDETYINHHETPGSIDSLSTMQNLAPRNFFDPSQYVAQAASDFLGQHGFDEFLGDGIFYEANSSM